MAEAALVAVGEADSQVNIFKTCLLSLFEFYQAGKIVQYSNEFFHLAIIKSGGGKKGGGTILIIGGRRRRSLSSR